MVRVNIFTDSILVDNFFNPEVDEEILKVLSKEEEKDQLICRSNIGGFQTDSINNETIGINILKKSVKVLSDNYRLKIKTNFELKNLWINKNYKHNFNVNHVHPGSNFSGVYYLEVTQEDGELVFLRNDTAASFNSCCDFIDDQNFSNFFTIKPKKNMLVLFPSHLNHFVKPHNEDISRISVSFNIGLING
tara:strand:- start:218 stop:790 length:573 start_codon:yes stop_codon:yes gene_type:complete